MLDPPSNNTYHIPNHPIQTWTTSTTSSKSSTSIVVILHTFATCGFYIFNKDFSIIFINCGEILRSCPNFTSNLKFIINFGNSPKFSIKHSTSTPFTSTSWCVVNSYLLHRLVIICWHSNSSIIFAFNCDFSMV